MLFGKKYAPCIQLHDLSTKHHENTVGSLPAKSATFWYVWLWGKSPHNLHWLLSARTTMWSMPVVLTEMENENDSVNQNDIAKMTLQKWCYKMMSQALTMLPADGIISNYPFNFVGCLLNFIVFEQYLN